MLIAHKYHRHRAVLTSAITEARSAHDAAALGSMSAATREPARVRQLREARRSRRQAE